jgi:hypothetical protein
MLRALAVSAQKPSIDGDGQFFAHGFDDPPAALKVPRAIAVVGRSTIHNGM